MLITRDLTHTQVDRPSHLRSYLRASRTCADLACPRACSLFLPLFLFYRRRPSCRRRRSRSQRTRKLQVASDLLSRYVFTHQSKKAHSSLIILTKMAILTINNNNNNVLSCYLYRRNASSKSLLLYKTLTRASTSTVPPPSPRIRQHPPPVSYAHSAPENLSLRVRA
jgi:hypothetical protein